MLPYWDRFFIGSQEVVLFIVLICNTGGDNVQPYWDRYFTGSQEVVLFIVLICNTGGDNVQPYWDRYFTGSQGVVLIIVLYVIQEGTMCGRTGIATLPGHRVNVQPYWDRYFTGSQVVVLIIVLIYNTGGDNVRPYWDRYFTGSQGVVFVVNSATSEEDMATANTELHKALADPELDGLPLLVLANYNDKVGARSLSQVIIKHCFYVQCQVCLMKNF